MRPWLVPALLSLVLALPGCSQPTTDETPDPSADGPFLAARLDSFVAQVVEKARVPGLTIAVSRGGESIYVRAFGVRDIESGEPLTSEHLFHMASVSKPFVATAVVQLWEKGKIDLDAPVTTYLPYFELADPRYREITIRQMLNHTSGMTDVRDYEWDKPQLDEGAAERFVRSLKDEEMIFAPGERLQYSNMAFDTLGDVIAKVSGQSFEDYVKAAILDPLGMTESTFLYPDTREDLRTRGHLWRGMPVASPVYPYNRRHAPSSTLNSNVVEMTRWARANLNRGELDGTRILEASSYDLLWTPSAESDSQSVGLSWFLGTYRDERTVEHSGGDTGYRSHLTLLPDRDMSLVMASNYEGAPIGGLRDGVLDILLGHDPEKPRIDVSIPFTEVYLADGPEAAMAEYRRLQDEASGEIAFHHRELNQVGYFFLGEDRVDDAIRVFRFNVELYPEESNPWDSLGEAYMVHGDKELAVENYRKSLELDPDNDNARQMLDRLGAPAES